MKTIEFACTHNNGRSPLAESFAKKHLNKLGESGYNTLSSGTKAQKIEDQRLGNKELSYEELAGFSDTLYENLEKFQNDLPNNMEKTIKKLESGETLSKEEFQNLQVYNQMILGGLVNKESQNREIAAEKFGIEMPKKLNKQTRANPDTYLLLTMNEKNSSEANEIYNNSGLEKPGIQTLPSYAQNKPSLEIPSSFGKDLDEYLEIAEEIRDNTYKAIDKAIH